jgi:hypothetical protein
VPNVARNRAHAAGCRLALCVAAVLWPGASSARAEPPDPGRYDALFLQPADFTSRMQKANDYRRMGSPPADAAFAKHRGLHFGFASWQSPPGPGAFWQVVDIRWVFPTPAQAAAYHEATLRAHSEGAPRIDGAPPPRDAVDVHVFGGARTSKGIPISNYFYIFRVGRVVVKLFVAAAPDPTRSLQPSWVVRLAEKAVARVRSARAE